MARLTALCAILVSACARLRGFSAYLSGHESEPLQHRGMQQSFTMNNSSIHYDPAVLAAGAAESQVRSTFGEPTPRRTTPPVNSRSLRLQSARHEVPRGAGSAAQCRVALAVFSMGTSMAARLARLHLAEKNLTLFRVTYSPNNTIQLVTTARMGDASQSLPTAQAQSQ